MFTITQRLRGMIGKGERLYAAPCILFAQELGAEVRYLDGSPMKIEDLTDGRKIAGPWILFPQGSDVYFPART